MKWIRPLYLILILIVFVFDSLSVSLSLLFWKRKLFRFGYVFTRE